MMTARSGSKYCQVCLANVDECGLMETHGHALVRRYLCGILEPANPNRAGTAKERQQQQQPGVAPQEEQDDAFDPWAPLDQHDGGGMAKKPFRKAKRLPRFKPAPPPVLPSHAAAVPPAAPGAFLSAAGTSRGRSPAKCHNLRHMAAAACWSGLLEMSILAGLPGFMHAVPLHAGKLAFAEFLPALQRAQHAKRAAAAAQRALAARRSAFVAPSQELQDDAAGLDDGGDGAHPRVPVWNLSAHLAQCVPQAVKLASPSFWSQVGMIAEVLAPCQTMTTTTCRSQTQQSQVPPLRVQSWILQSDPGHWCRLLLRMTAAHHWTCVEVHRCLLCSTSMGCGGGSAKPGGRCGAHLRGAVSGACQCHHQRCSSSRRADSAGCQVRKTEECMMLFQLDAVSLVGKIQSEGMAVKWSDRHKSVC